MNQCFCMSLVAGMIAAALVLVDKEVSVRAFIWYVLATIMSIGGVIFK